MKTPQPFAMFPLCGFLCLAAVQSAIAQNPIKSPDQYTVKPIPGFKLCPDLRANLTLSQSSNGMIKLNGTITNIGKGNYDGASVAEVIMNLAYAPQYSYNMTGVSDILVTKPFTTLKPGASISINTNFKIPDFGGWASINAKRLFTLRAVKQDMSPYQPGEDCNPDNNSAGVVAAYRDTKH